ncbi:sigma 54-interacting transcriptional regulator [Paraneptunicella aestuarii]|uniref:sigma-54 interaction domain-containing protein n=1 Tax=Paraneptunicella aestuarii TaxID=2831148 RepID=UPI001E435081|nr:sigma 54-interacting transcriptional regulator [Paraneptunicella aestuarii]UAA37998.1 sigma 54-interacting transcriptional regulator [Paraneptunicella aestuarii]
MPSVAIIESCSHTIEEIRHSIAQTNHKIIAITSEFEESILTHLCPDIIIADFSFVQRKQFMLFMEKLHSISPNTIIIAAIETNNDALVEKALEIAVNDIIRKPICARELVHRIQLNSELKSLLKEANASNKIAPSTKQETQKNNLSSDQILGDSEQIHQLNATIKRASRLDWNALILGKSGSGKELVAKEIHKKSNRWSSPFIALNCAGLNESLLNSQLFGHEKGAFTGADKQVKGVFELADSGTLFLDEIGDLPLSMQGILLRVLQDSQVTRVGAQTPINVDVRLVFATHKPLQQLVQEGKFREDLYYRINSLIINVPSLKERRSDIPLLLTSFLNKLSISIDEDPKQLNADAMHWLTQQLWPGNVRQLQQVARKLTLLTYKYISLEDCMEAYGAEHVEQNVQPRLEISNYKNIQQKNEAEYIRKILIECNGVRSDAAKRLGIGRATLYRKLKSLNIDD